MGHPEARRRTLVVVATTSRRETEGAGPEGIRTLDLSVSLGRRRGRADKSRSLYLAKLQARGRAY